MQLVAQGERQAGYGHLRVQSQVLVEDPLPDRYLLGEVRGSGWGVSGPAETSSRV